MRIIIEYEASWRNSFLSGSNDEPLPKKGRDFVASMTGLKADDNFISRPISKNTVMGVLSRLIGDQRKLYQAKSSGEYYFADIENQISFEDKSSIITEEIVYIRNMKGSTDQNSFTGMIKVNDPIFLSDYSAQLWGVLALDIEQLYTFIIDNQLIDKFVLKNPLPLDPVSVLSRLAVIGKIKPMPADDRLIQAANQLASHFDDYKPKNAKDLYLALPLYCSALYLQLQRLASRFDVSSAKSKKGGISGISKNGFTPKDFMDKYTTGSKKLIYGNPYIKETFVEGEGKVKHSLNKASGQLTITLDIDILKAKELKQMINNAGVSSFYLGKKGLAYVSDIRLQ